MPSETSNPETQEYRGVSREQKLTPHPQWDGIDYSLVLSMDHAHDDEHEQAHYVFLTADVLELLRKREASVPLRQPLELDLLRLAEGCAECLDEDDLA